MWLGQAYVITPQAVVSAQAIIPMPYDLPAATVVTLGLHLRPVDAPNDKAKAWIPSGSHGEILHRCADQDGYNGQIMCRLKGELFAIPPGNLRL